MAALRSTGGWCIFIVLLSLTLVLADAREAAGVGGVSQVRAPTAGRAVELEGRFVVVHQDFAQRGRYLYFLQTPQRRLSLHFANSPPTHLLTGTSVRLRAIPQPDGSLMLASGNASITAAPATGSLAAPLPNTLGAQSTAVMLVNFQDDPANRPWTAAQVQSAVFGSAGASGFLMEASYGQTQLTGNVYGWYTIPYSSAGCDSIQIAADANSAAASAGVSPAAYTRLIYVFPYNSACGWSGMATVGGNPSQAWINGGGTTTNSLQVGAIAHELGHNLGLYHSHGLDCGAVALSGECTVYEYFDTIDTMGSQQGHYNAFQKERLGWLNYGSSPPITAANTSGTYFLAPYETADSKAKALKILKFTNPATGASYYYYIEYRQALGFDSFISSMANQNVTGGVVVHLAQQGDANSSDLLDMTPNSSAYFEWNDVALVAGASYADSDAGLVITTQSADAAGAGAGVAISLTQPNCLRALPQIAISPAQAGPIAAGSTVNYTVSVTNADSSNCGASAFKLQSALPYGWTGGLAGSQLTIGPGTSSWTSLSVTSPPGAPDGSQPVSVTAASMVDFVYTNSAAATYVISLPLALTVATTQSTYSAGQTVVVTATVTAQGVAVAKAAVAFTITLPDGSVVNGSRTTGSNGGASFSFKLGRHPAKGIYTAMAQTTVNGASASASAEFSVQ
jgi:hypothetical protein